MPAHQCYRYRLAAVPTDSAQTRRPQGENGVVEANTPAQEVFYGLNYRAGGHAVQARCRPGIPTRGNCRLMPLDRACLADAATRPHGDAPGVFAAGTARQHGMQPCASTFGDGSNRRGVRASAKPPAPGVLPTTPGRGVFTAEGQHRYVLLPSNLESPRARVSLPFPPEDSIP